MIAPCEFVLGHFGKFAQFLLQIAVGITLYSLRILKALRTVDMRINSQRVIMLFTALCLPSFSGPARAASDADIKAQPESIRMLADYLKIDTTNPPGNEKLGAEYLASILRSNGIEAEIFDTAPNRSCVYARLKGNGKKKAIVLLNHIDVVPARAEDWKYPPFGGEIHDGELWGRGALDMKGMGIIELEAMLRLKRSGVVLDRDIIFLATPDEEVGGDQGAKWFKDHKADLLKDAEFLLNEGFHIDTDKNGKVLYWGVNVAEKSLIWLKVTAKGDAGHASMPIANSAPNRLVRGLTRLIDSAPNPVVLPLVQEYFAKISVNETGKTKEAYADVKKAIENPELRSLVLKDKMKGPMLLNTVSLTVLKAGYKTNVIPAEAYAELDCRLLPGTDHAKFAEEVKAKLGDPTLEVSVLESELAVPSSPDTDLFAAIKAVAQAEKPGVPVVPVVVQWFTDSHWFRELGLTAYGWEPVEQDPEHIATVHGKNERVSLKGLEDGANRMEKVLLKLAKP
jgi:acetylornithine deacetylase/succinyl-diaminopimelate desuccinylase-like protein